MTRRTIFFAVLILSLSFGIAACKKKSVETPDEKTAEPESTEERYKIELDGSPRIGGADPLVTIVNFSDFECPFSKRIFETIDRLLKKHGDRIAHVYKHYPLATHREARRAAKAAIAAQAQDKFAPLAAKLFEHGQEISEENILLWAAEAELDLDRFRTDLAAAGTETRLHEDITQGNIFGVRGTPTIFVNGIRVIGADSDLLEKTVAEQLAHAERLRAGGTTDIYRTLIANARERYVPPKRPAPVVPKDIYAVEPPPHAPVWGSPDAPITMVLFVDFECPFCARLHETLNTLRQDAQFPFRTVHINLPLKFHPRAIPAAKAVIAAGRQDKFPEAYERLFAEQTEWKKSADLDGYLAGLATALGLDPLAFKKDFDDPRVMELIHRDLAFADEMGIRGTPGIFINGRYVSGAYPLESFQTTLREELERARPLMEKGLKGDELYRALIRGGKSTLLRTAPVVEDPDTIHAIALTGREAATGPDNAPVTIVEFSDLQCAPCRETAGALDTIEKEYRDRVRIVHKHLPLAAHPQAHPAARLLTVVLRKHGYGPYRTMRNKLFSAQNEWANADHETVFGRYAAEQKLDMAALKKELADPAIELRIKEDIAEAAKNGVRSVPVLFVNGRKLTGPQSPDQLKTVIEGILRKKE